MEPLGKRKNTQVFLVSKSLTAKSNDILVHICIVVSVCCLSKMKQRR